MVISSGGSLGQDDNYAQQEQGKRIGGLHLVESDCLFIGDGLCQSLFL